MALLSASPNLAAEIERRLTLPPADADIIPALAVIAAKCGRRREDDRASDFTLKVYMADLRAYPGDIVAAVLKHWPECSRWWPDWCDLFALLEELMVERRRVVALARSQAGLPSLGVDAASGGETGLLVRQAARKLGLLK